MTTAKDQHLENATLTPTEDASAEKETTKVSADALVGKVKGLIHEGNVRRILVKNSEGHTVMEIPVTAGVIAAVALPIVTAVSAIAALANDWTIEVHRKLSE